MDPYNQHRNRNQFNALKAVKTQLNKSFENTSIRPWFTHKKNGKIILKIHKCIGLRKFKKPHRHKSSK